MALIKQTLYPVTNACVIEDISTGAGSNRIYLGFDSFDKTTLTPMFNEGLNHNTSGTGLTTFGFNYIGTENYNSSTMGKIFVNGPVTEVTIGQTSNNTPWNNLDPTMWHSMDPTRPLRKIRLDSNGSQSVLGLYGAKVAFDASIRSDDGGFWSSETNSALPYTIVCLRYNCVNMRDTLPFYSGTRGFQNAGSTGIRGGANFYPVYYNPTTNNLITMSFSGCRNAPDEANTNTRQTRAPACMQGTRVINYLGVHSFSWGGTQTYYQLRSQQFIGVDTGGRALFFINSHVDDYTHIIYRYTDADNTFTNLFSNSTAPTAAGTNLGGNRGTNYSNYIVKYSSLTFADPTSAGNRAWYTPYFDNAGKFHPFFFQWNVTTDTFTRNSDISINWAGGSNQDNVWAHDTYSASGYDSSYGMQRIVFNDTFVSGGNRYLTFGLLHGSGTAYDPYPKTRTFVTFQVDAANPRVLTYHSSFIIPSTPRNIIYFDDVARTTMGILSVNNFYVYNFTPVSGWTLTQTIPYTFAGVGVDSLGRIWAVAPGRGGYLDTHLITLNMPTNISVTTSQATYNFTGTNINSTITVNAYNYLGTRIAVNVKLVIDGGSMTFSTGGITTTVATSATADTSVPIIVTGAGVSNIIASVVI